MNKRNSNRKGTLRWNNLISMAASKKCFSSFTEDEAMDEENDIYVFQVHI